MDLPPDLIPPGLRSSDSVRSTTVVLPQKYQLQNSIAIAVMMRNVGRHYHNHAEKLRLLHMESGHKPPQPTIIINTFIVIQLCYGIYNMAKTKTKQLQADSVRQHQVARIHRKYG